MQPANRKVSLVLQMGERYINRALDGTGVTSGTAPLLLQLRDGGSQSPGALALAIGVDKGHVTRSLQALRRSGFVAVAPDPGDGRKVIASLTSKGQEMADRAEQAMLAWRDLVSAGVSSEILQIVDSAMSAFYTNAVMHFAETSQTGVSRPPTAGRDQPADSVAGQCLSHLLHQESSRATLEVGQSLPDWFTSSCADQCK